MDADGRIRTQFDDLVASLKLSGSRPQSVSELSSAANLPPGHVAKWLYILEKNGQVRLENRLSGIYAVWTGEPEKTKPVADEAVVVSPTPESDIEIARAHEAEAQEARDAAAQKKRPESDARLRHRLELDAADAELAFVGEKIGRINNLLAQLRQRQQPPKEAAQPEAEAAKSAAEEAQQLAEEARRAAGKELPQKEEAGGAPEEAVPFESAAGELEEEEEPIQPVGHEAEAVVSEEEKPETPEIQPPAVAGKIPKAKVKIKPIYQKKKKGLIEKIRKPAPLQVTGVSLQFSERLARQVRRITHQTQEVERLRMEKEKLLSEHYRPMQRKLEVEIETISDRVLRIEKDILGLHQRASELPGKVSSVEKLQISSIKAHAEMRKAYDEASALVEESTRLLAEEREKMEQMTEQSRLEISAHRSKTEELESTLRHIAGMEEQAESAVVAARAALAEQAERLASAEKSAQELSSLKSEIGESVAGIKREISTAKGALTTLEKQMSQMRQVEIWAASIRQDYEKKMLEIDDYIKEGNREFETLREAVEASFVRRYLRELRQLTDSYTFELNQVKNVEGSIDQRISEEKRKLEALLEEGRKISYLYEMQSKEPEGADKFEKHGEEFRELEGIASQRSQLEQMIAQVVGSRSEYQPAKAEEKKETAAAEPKKARARPVARKKAKPVKKGAKAKKRAKPAKKAARPKGKR